MAVLSTVRRYVPRYGDNRKKPEEEQIAVFLRNINVKDRQFQMKKYIKMEGAEIMDRMMEDKETNEIHDILKKNVVRFHNLILEDEVAELDASGQPKLDENGDPMFKTVTRSAKIQDLFDQGEWFLCVELFMEIVNGSQLSKEMEKNSEAQSGSTEQKAIEGEVVPVH